MKHRDCEIYIKCDDQRMQEHDVRVDGNVVSCYLASEANKIFTIVGMKDSPTLDLNVAASVDGRNFPTNTILRASSRQDTTITCRESIAGIRQLLFSNIGVTDDESAASILPDAGHLGLIQIRIYRVRIDGQKPYKHPAKDAAENFGPLHERTKKGGMHCISFGETEAQPVTSMLSATSLDIRSSPYITFNFRYRPRAILQAQGIIESIANEPAPVESGATGTSSARDAAVPVPHPESGDTSGRKRQDDSASTGPRKRSRRDRASSSASPAPEAGQEPGASQRDNRNLCAKKDEKDEDEELSALQAQIQVLQNRMNRIEDQRGEAGRSRLVKREPSPIRLGSLHGKVIDLTDD